MKFEHWWFQELLIFMYGNGLVVIFIYIYVYVCVCVCIKVLIFQRCILKYLQMKVLQDNTGQEEVGGGRDETRLAVSWNGWSWVMRTWEFIILMFTLVYVWNFPQIKIFNKDILEVKLNLCRVIWEPNNHLIHVSMGKYFPSFSDF